MEYCIISQTMLVRSLYSRKNGFTTIELWKLTLLICILYLTFDLMRYYLTFFCFPKPSPVNFVILLFKARTLGLWCIFLFPQDGILIPQNYLLMFYAFQVDKNIMYWYKPSSSDQTSNQVTWNIINSQKHIKYSSRLSPAKTITTRISYKKDEMNEYPILRHHKPEESRVFTVKQEIYSE